MAATSKHVSFSALALLAILVHVSYATHDVDDSVVESAIDIKPGGVEHTVVKNIGEFECIFTYVCQGGTNEKWDFVMTVTQDRRHFSCTVERGNGKSYLFFQSFSMQVKGASVVEASAFADLATSLSTSEFSIDYKNGKVSHLDGFKSKLVKLDVFATKEIKHSEL